MRNDDMLFHRFLKVKSAVLEKAAPKTRFWELQKTEEYQNIFLEFSIVLFLFLVF